VPHRVQIRELYRYLRLRCRGKLIFKGAPLSRGRRFEPFLRRPLLAAGTVYLVEGDTAMKTILFAMIALSVLMSVATPAGANPFTAKGFYEQQERFSGGANGS
jgi:hypothetical protein